MIERVRAWWRRWRGTDEPVGPATPPPGAYEEMYPGEFARMVVAMAAFESGETVVGELDERGLRVRVLGPERTDRPGYYYEHVDGSTHYKPFAVVDMAGGPHVYFDSPAVRRWWKVEVNGG